MDAERRHELQENDLARYLMRAFSGVQEGGSRLLMLMAGVAVVFLLIWVLQSSRVAQAQEDQRAFLTALESAGNLDLTETPDYVGALASLETVAETASQPKIVMQALAEWGSRALQYTVTSDDPEEKKTLNELARTAFSRLGEEFSDNPAARAVSRFGLATVHENAFAQTGDLSNKDAARVLLEQIRDDSDLAGFPMQDQVLRRLNTIEAVFTPVSFPAEPVSVTVPSDLEKASAESEETPDDASADNESADSDSTYDEPSDGEGSEESDSGDNG